MAYPNTHSAYAYDCYTQPCSSVTASHCPPEDEQSGCITSTTFDANGNQINGLCAPDTVAGKCVDGPEIYGYLHIDHFTCAFTYDEDTCDTTPYFPNDTWGNITTFIVDWPCD